MIISEAMNPKKWTPMVTLFSHWKWHW